MSRSRRCEQKGLSDVNHLTGRHDFHRIAFGVGSVLSVVVISEVPGNKRTSRASYLWMVSLSDLSTLSLEGFASFFKVFFLRTRVHTHTHLLGTNDSVNQNSCFSPSR